MTLPTTVSRFGLVALVSSVALVAPACSSTPATPSDRVDAAAHETGSPEAAIVESSADGPAEDEDSSSLAPDGSTQVDTGPNDHDGGAEASVCVGLGAPCTDSTTCLCGTASGCTWDNVDCSAAAVCALTYEVSLDAGNTCCSACQATYDSCTASGESCLSQWLACNQACPGGSGACPVGCFAQP